MAAVQECSLALCLVAITDELLGLSMGIQINNYKQVEHGKLLRVQPTNLM
jgi:hypothetical protein